MMGSYRYESPNAERKYIKQTSVRQISSFNTDPMRDKFRRISCSAPTVENSGIIAYDIKRHIIETKEQVKRSPNFVKRTHSKIIYLHNYNCRVAQICSMYPLDDNFKQLLIKYIELEVSILRNPECNTEAYRLTLETRVLTLMSTIYSKYCFYTRGRFSKNDTWQYVLELFEDVPYNVHEFFEDIRKKVMQRIDLSSDLNLPRGDPITVKSQLTCYKVPDGSIKVEMVKENDPLLRCCEAYNIVPEREDNAVELAMENGSIGSSANRLPLEGNDIILSDDELTDTGQLQEDNIKLEYSLMVFPSLTERLKSLKKHATFMEDTKPVIIDLCDDTQDRNSQRRKSHAKDIITKTSLRRDTVIDLLNSSDDEENSNSNAMVKKTSARPRNCDKIVDSSVIDLSDYSGKNESVISSVSKTVPDVLISDRDNSIYQSQDEREILRQIRELKLLSGSSEVTIKMVDNRLVITPKDNLNISSVDNGSENQSVSIDTTPTIQSSHEPVEPIAVNKDNSSTNVDFCTESLPHQQHSVEELIENKDVDTSVEKNPKVTFEDKALGHESVNTDNSSTNVDIYSESLHNYRHPADELIEKKRLDDITTSTTSHLETCIEKNPNVTPKDEPVGPEPLNADNFSIKVDHCTESLPHNQHSIEELIEKKHLDDITTSNTSHLQTSVEKPPILASEDEPVIPEPGNNYNSSTIVLCTESLPHQQQPVEKLIEKIRFSDITILNTSHLETSVEDTPNGISQDNDSTFQHPTTVVVYKSSVDSKFSWASSGSFKSMYETEYEQLLQSTESADAGDIDLISDNIAQTDSTLCSSKSNSENCNEANQMSQFSEVTHYVDQNFGSVCQVQTTTFSPNTNANFIEYIEKGQHRAAITADAHEHESPVDLRNENVGLENYILLDDDEAKEDLDEEKLLKEDTKLLDTEVKSEPSYSSGDESYNNEHFCEKDVNEADSNEFFQKSGEDSPFKRENSEVFPNTQTEVLRVVSTDHQDNSNIFTPTETGPEYQETQNQIHLSTIGRTISGAEQNISKTTIYIDKERDVSFKDPKELPLDVFKTDKNNVNITDIHRIEETFQNNEQVRVHSEDKPSYLNIGVEKMYVPNEEGTICHTASDLQMEETKNDLDRVIEINNEVVQIDKDVLHRDIEIPLESLSLEKTDENNSDVFVVASENAQAVSKNIEISSITTDYLRLEDLSESKQLLLEGSKMWNENIHASEIALSYDNKDIQGVNISVRRKKDVSKKTELCHENLQITGTVEISVDITENNKVEDLPESGNNLFSKEIDESSKPEEAEDERKNAIDRKKDDESPENDQLLRNDEEMFSENLTTEKEKSIDTTYQQNRQLTEKQATNNECKEIQQQNEQCETHIITEVTSFASTDPLLSGDIVYYPEKLQSGQIEKPEAANDGKNVLSHTYICDPFHYTDVETEETTDNLENSTDSIVNSQDNISTSELSSASFNSLVSVGSNTKTNEDRDENIDKQEGAVCGDIPCDDKNVEAEETTDNLENSTDSIENSQDTVSISELSSTSFNSLVSVGSNTEANEHLDENIDKQEGEVCGDEPCDDKNVAAEETTDNLENSTDSIENSQATVSIGELNRTSFNSLVSVGSNTEANERLDENIDKQEVEVSGDEPSVDKNVAAEETTDNLENSTHSIVNSQDTISISELNRTSSNSLISVGSNTGANEHLDENIDKQEGGDEPSDDKNVDAEETTDTLENSTDSIVNSQVTISIGELNRTSSNSVVSVGSNTGANEDLDENIDKQEGEVCGDEPSDGKNVDAEETTDTLENSTDSIVNSQVTISIGELNRTSSNSVVSVGSNTGANEDLDENIDKQEGKVCWDEPSDDKNVDAEETTDTLENSTDSIVNSQVTISIGELNMTSSNLVVSVGSNTGANEDLDENIDKQEVCGDEPSDDKNVDAEETDTLENSSDSIVNSQVTISIGELNRTSSNSVVSVGSNTGANEDLDENIDKQEGEVCGDEPSDDKNVEAEEIDNLENSTYSIVNLQDTIGISELNRTSSNSEVSVGSNTGANEDLDENIDKQEGEVCGDEPSDHKNVEAEETTDNLENSTDSIVNSHDIVSTRELSSTSSNSLVLVGSNNETSEDLDENIDKQEVEVCGDEPSDDKNVDAEETDTLENSTDSIVNSQVTISIGELNRTSSNSVGSNTGANEDLDENIDKQEGEVCGDEPSDDKNVEAEETIDNLENSTYSIVNLQDTIGISELNRTSSNSVVSVGSNTGANEDLDENIDKQEGEVCGDEPSDHKNVEAEETTDNLENSTDSIVNSHDIVSTRELSSTNSNSLVLVGSNNETSEDLDENIDKQEGEVRGESPVYECLVYDAVEIPTWEYCEEFNEIEIANTDENIEHLMDTEVYLSEKEDKHDNVLTVENAGAAAAEDQGEHNFLEQKNKELESDGQNYKRLELQNHEPIDPEIKIVGIESKANIEVFDSTQNMTKNNLENSNTNIAELGNQENGNTERIDQPDRNEKTSEQNIELQTRGANHNDDVFNSQNVFLKEKTNEVLITTTKNIMVSETECENLRNIENVVPSHVEDPPITAECEDDKTLSENADMSDFLHVNDNISIEESATLDTLVLGVSNDKRVVENLLDYIVCSVESSEDVACNQQDQRSQTVLETLRFVSEESEEEKEGNTNFSVEANGDQKIHVGDKISLIELNEINILEKSASSSEVVSQLEKGQVDLIDSESTGNSCTHSLLYSKEPFVDENLKESDKEIPEDYRNLKGNEYVLYTPEPLKYTVEQLRILKSEETKAREDPLLVLNALKNTNEISEERALNLINCKNDKENIKSRKSELDNDLQPLNLATNNNIGEKESEKVVFKQSTSVLSQQHDATHGPDQKNRGAEPNNKIELQPSNIPSAECLASYLPKNGKKMENCSLVLYNADKDPLQYLRQSLSKFGTDVIPKTNDGPLLLLADTAIQCGFISPESVDRGSDSEGLLLIDEDSCIPQDYPEVQSEVILGPPEDHEENEFTLQIQNSYQTLLGKDGSKRKKSSSQLKNSITLYKAESEISLPVSHNIASPIDNSERDLLRIQNYQELDVKPASRRPNILKRRPNTKLGTNEKRSYLQPKLVILSDKPKVSRTKTKAEKKQMPTFQPNENLQEKSLQCESEDDIPLAERVKTRTPSPKKDKSRYGTTDIVVGRQGKNEVLGENAKKSRIKSGDRWSDMRENISFIEGGTEKHAKSKKSPVEQEVVVGESLRKRTRRKSGELQPESTLKNQRKAGERFFDKSSSHAHDEVEGKIKDNDTRKAYRSKLRPRSISGSDFIVETPSLSAVDPASHTEPIGMCVEVKSTEESSKRLQPSDRVKRRSGAVSEGTSEILMIGDNNFVPNEKSDDIIDVESVPTYISKSGQENNTELPNVIDPYAFNIENEPENVTKLPSGLPRGRKSAKASNDSFEPLLVPFRLSGKRGRGRGRGRKSVNIIKNVNHQQQSMVTKVNKPKNSKKGDLKQRLIDVSITPQVNSTLENATDCALTDTYGRLASPKKAGKKPSLKIDLDQTTQNCIPKSSLATNTPIKVEENSPMTSPAPFATTPKERYKREFKAQIKSAKIELSPKSVESELVQAVRKLNIDEMSRSHQCNQESPILESTKGLSEIKGVKKILHPKLKRKSLFSNCKNHVEPITQKLLNRLQTDTAKLIDDKNVIGEQNGGIGSSQLDNNNSVEGAKLRNSVNKVSISVENIGETACVGELNYQESGKATDRAESPFESKEYDFKVVESIPDETMKITHQSNEESVNLAVNHRASLETAQKLETRLEEQPLKTDDNLDTNDATVLESCILSTGSEVSKQDLLQEPILKNTPLSVCDQSDSPLELLNTNPVENSDKNIDCSVDYYMLDDIPLSKLKKISAAKRVDENLDITCVAVSDNKFSHSDHKISSDQIKIEPEEGKYLDHQIEGNLKSESQKLLCDVIEEVIIESSQNVQTSFLNKELNQKIEEETVKDTSKNEQYYETVEHASSSDQQSEKNQRESVVVDVSMDENHSDLVLEQHTDQTIPESSSERQKGEQQEISIQDAVTKNHQTLTFLNQQNVENAIEDSFLDQRLEHKQDENIIDASMNAIQSTVDEKRAEKQGLSVQVVPTESQSTTYSHEQNIQITNQTSLTENKEEKQKETNVDISNSDDHNIGQQNVKIDNQSFPFENCLESERRKVHIELATTIDGQLATCVDEHNGKTSIQENVEVFSTINDQSVVSSKPQTFETLIHTFVKQQEEDTQEMPLNANPTISHSTASSETLCDDEIAKISDHDVTVSVEEVSVNKTYDSNDSDLFSIAQEAAKHACENFEEQGNYFDDSGSQVKHYLDISVGSEVEILDTSEFDKEKEKLEIQDKLLHLLHDNVRNDDLIASEESEKKKAADLDGCDHDLPKNRNTPTRKSSGDCVFIEKVDLENLINNKISSQTKLEKASKFVEPSKDSNLNVTLGDSDSEIEIKQKYLEKSKKKGQDSNQERTKYEKDKTMAEGENKHSDSERHRTKDQKYDKYRHKGRTSRHNRSEERDKRSESKRDRSESVSSINSGSSLSNCNVRDKDRYKDNDRGRHSRSTTFSSSRDKYKHREKDNSEDKRKEKYDRNRSKSSSDRKAERSEDKRYKDPAKKLNKYENSTEEQYKDKHEKSNREEKKNYSKDDKKRDNIKEYNRRDKSPSKTTDSKKIKNKEYSKDRRMELKSNGNKSDTKKIEKSFQDNRNDKECAKKKCGNGEQKESGKNRRGTGHNTKLNSQKELTSKAGLFILLDRESIFHNTYDSTKKYTDMADSQKLPITSTVEHVLKSQISLAKEKKVKNCQETKIKDVEKKVDKKEIKVEKQDGLCKGTHNKVVNKNPPNNKNKVAVNVDNTSDKEISIQKSTKLVKNNLKSSRISSNEVISHEARNDVPKLIEDVQNTKNNEVKNKINNRISSLNKKLGESTRTTENKNLTAEKRKSIIEDDYKTDDCIDATPVQPKKKKMRISKIQKSLIGEFVQCSDDVGQKTVTMKAPVLPVGKKHEEPRVKTVVDLSKEPSESCRETLQPTQITAKNLINEPSEPCSEKLGPIEKINEPVFITDNIKFSSSHVYEEVDNKNINNIDEELEKQKMEIMSSKTPDENFVVSTDQILKGEVKSTSLENVLQKGKDLSDGQQPCAIENEIDAASTLSGKDGHCNDSAVSATNEINQHDQPTTLDPAAEVVTNVSVGEQASQELQYSTISNRWENTTNSQLQPVSELQEKDNLAVLDSNVDKEHSNLPVKCSKILIIDHQIIHAYPNAKAQRTKCSLTESVFRVKFAENLQPSAELSPIEKVYEKLGHSASTGIAATTDQSSSAKKVMDHLSHLIEDSEKLPATIPQVSDQSNIMDPLCRNKQKRSREEAFSEQVTEASKKYPAVIVKTVHLPAVSLDPVDRNCSENLPDTPSQGAEIPKKRSKMDESLVNSTVEESQRGDTKLDHQTNNVLTSLPLRDDVSYFELSLVTEVTDGLANDRVNIDVPLKITGLPSHSSDKPDLQQKKINKTSQEIINETFEQFLRSSEKIPKNRSISSNNVAQVNDGNIKLTPNIQSSIAISQILTECVASEPRMEMSSQQKQSASELPDFKRSLYEEAPNYFRNPSPPVPASIDSISNLDFRNPSPPMPTSSQPISGNCNKNMDLDPYSVCFDTQRPQILPDFVENKDISTLLDNTSNASQNNISAGSNSLSCVPTTVPSSQVNFEHIYGFQNNLVASAMNDITDTTQCVVPTPSGYMRGLKEDAFCETKTEKPQFSHREDLSDILPSDVKFLEEYPCASPEQVLPNFNRNETFGSSPATSSVSQHSENTRDAADNGISSSFHTGDHTYPKDVLMNWHNEDKNELNNQNPSGDDVKTEYEMDELEIALGLLDEPSTPASGIYHHSSSIPTDGAWLFDVEPENPNKNLTTWDDRSKVVVEPQPQGYSTVYLDFLCQSDSLTSDITELSPGSESSDLDRGNINMTEWPDLPNTPEILPEKTCLEKSVIDPASKKIKTKFLAIREVKGPKVKAKKPQIFIPPRQHTRTKVSAPKVGRESSTANNHISSHSPISDSKEPTKEPTQVSEDVKEEGGQLPVLAPLSAIITRSASKRDNYVTPQSQSMYNSISKSSNEEEGIKTSDSKVESSSKITNAVPGGVFTIDALLLKTNMLQSEATIKPTHVPNSNSPQSILISSKESVHDSPPKYSSKQSNILTKTPAVSLQTDALKQEHMTFSKGDLKGGQVVRLKLVNPTIFKDMRSGAKNIANSKTSAPPLVPLQLENQPQLPPNEPMEINRNSLDFSKNVLNIDVNKKSSIADDSKKSATKAPKKEPENITTPDNSLLFKTRSMTRKIKEFLSEAPKRPSVEAALPSANKIRCVGTLPSDAFDNLAKSPVNPLFKNTESRLHDEDNQRRYSRSHPRDGQSGSARYGHGSDFIEHTEKRQSQHCERSRSAGGSSRWSSRSPSSHGRERDIRSSKYTPPDSRSKSDLHKVTMRQSLFPELPHQTGKSSSDDHYSDGSQKQYEWLKLMKIDPEWMSLPAQSRSHPSSGSSK